MWSPTSAHFDAIVPCGVADPRYGVTSLADLGHPVTMADVDIALRQAFEEVFGAMQACRKRRSESGSRVFFERPDFRDIMVRRMQPLPAA